MTDLSNEQFADAFGDDLAALIAGDIDLATFKSRYEGDLNSWYTLPITAANRLASIIGAIDGVIITDGVPGASVGDDGAYAFDATNGGFYGPKTSGAWGSSNFSLVGPQGPQGDKGDTGDAATISVGTVSTGAAGSSATVTNSGTSGAAVFDFSIPRGDTGAAGADGADGADGDAATISVGAVTTGAAGSSATVTNSGTSSAAVFDFTIPQGAKGDTGDTGATGPQGTVGDSFQGAWDSATTYAADDIVTYQGETWLALQGSTNSAPAENATWTKLAAKGADGSGSGTVTSVAVSGSDGIEVDSGSPITSSGTIALGVNAAALRTHINVEDGADVTDATNVAAAGARMAADDVPLADIAQGGATDGQVLAWNNTAGAWEAQDGGGGGGGVTVAAIQTSAFTPAPGNAYPIDTSGGAIALTALPSSPSQGDRFELHDPLRAWDATNSVTVPGTDGINGRSEDQIITLTGARVIFEYTDNAYGWEMKVLQPEGQFAYSAPFVNTPSITAPSLGATDIGETPTITSSAFAVTNDTDTHLHSDWQIASDSGFSTIVAESLDDTSNLESWTVPAGNLSTSTTYYVRVRHHGTTLGDSQWSEAVNFTTAAEFSKFNPVRDEMVTAPSAGDQTAYETFADGLDTDGLWDKHSWLMVLAADTTQQALLNWIDPAGTTGSEVNSPTFTANVGFKGDAVSAAIDTGAVPGNLESDTSVTMWVYVATISTAGTGNQPMAECNTGGNISLSDRKSFPDMSGAVAGDFVDSAGAPSAGNFYAVVRDGTSLKLYEGATEIGDATVSTPESLSTTDAIHLLAAINNGSRSSFNDAEISAFGLAEALSASEISDLSSRVTTLIGAL